MKMLESVISSKKTAAEISAKVSELGSGSFSSMTVSNLAGSRRIGAQLPIASHHIRCTLKTGRSTNYFTPLLEQCSFCFGEWSGMNWGNDLMEAYFSFK